MAGDMRWVHRLLDMLLNATGGKKRLPGSATKDVSGRTLGLDGGEFAFRRAFGLTHTGKPKPPGSGTEARITAGTLSEIDENTGRIRAQIQRESAEAWITLAEGKGEEALRQMRRAVRTKTRLTSTPSRRV